MRLNGWGLLPEPRSDGWDLSLATGGFCTMTWAEAGSERLPISSSTINWNWLAPAGIGFLSLNATSILGTVVTARSPGLTHVHTYLTIFLPPAADELLPSSTNPLPYWTDGGAPRTAFGRPAVPGRLVPGAGGSV